MLARGLVYSVQARGCHSAPRGSILPFVPDGAGDVVVRPYRPSDREAVRRICYLTGYMGDPVDWLWPDAESFSDMFSGYYTDVEPESAFVAEVGGAVSGYLLGCVDTRRAWNPARVAVRHAFLRGLAFRPGTGRVIWRAVADGVLSVASGKPMPAPFLDDRFPAHLHIDLLPSARGSGVGAALMRRWLDHLAGKGVPGCHLETMSENERAVVFFEAMGFEPTGDPVVVPGWRARTGGRHHIQVMVRALAQQPPGP